MTITFSVAVTFPGEEDEQLVDVDVYAVYGDHGIGSYEYAGIRGYHKDYRWDIEEWTWDQSKYTKEQNEAINEACYREQSEFIDTFERESRDI